MRISAIIPTYNRRPYIRRAIDSAVEQTLPADEIIVVDDERSSDRIEEALAEWYGTRVRVVKSGGGLSGARRRGVQEARGEWIAFLDSDDEWTQDRNEQLMSAAAEMPDTVGWIFGNTRVIADQGDQTTLFEEYGLPVKDRPCIFSDSLSVQYPFMFGLVQSSLIRRSALLEVDCFREGLRSSEDLLVSYQVALRHRFAAIPGIVCRRHVTSDLASTSVSVAEVLGPDYFRARVLAFGAVVESGRTNPWTARHAEEVRGLVQALARRGEVSRTLSMQQFRFGHISAKSILFCFAAILGRSAILLWGKISTRLERRRRAQQQKGASKGGHRAWAQSLGKAT